ncbi:hypothetical protein SADUNF_Sadunf19G0110800 [Salix dunnii]|uniref:RNase H type-1 domain-containing protein n=1 Tax=Salix dunnii TaxID=1413687 RepID=A0A835J2A5_9ROSI|nr:hypothetical protein SADUNF_Sadunf19G0110800 [Salix dunnii]
MLDDLLEANIIELPEVKRPEEANQVDNPNYCKYHRLISHPVEKCFVLKDKIMRLHENGDIIFDDEIAASNITTTVKLGPCQSLSTISFGSCEPIRLNAIFPMSFTASSSQTPCITPTPPVDDLKPKWSENYDDEGWTLVTRRRGRRKYMQMIKPTRMRISMVRKLIGEPIRRKTQQKSIPVRKEGFSAQSIRKPITLNEYMPTEMKRIENIPVACYQVDEEKTPIDYAMKKNHDDSASLSHGVCTTEISFNDEDLLLGSKLHNRPLFIKGYVDEKKVNRILVDDGSAVNILPLKTMRELGIPMDELFPSHLMIQGFNQGGQNAIGKIRLAMHMEDMESNALFHVIDAKTTYNILLGRPWIHENGIISSTLHQCFKYCRDGRVRKIMADTDPFTIVEAHFADAKFYFKSNMMEELRSPPDHLGEGIIDFKSPKRHEKEGQSSFAKDEEKINKELENLTLPATNLVVNKVSKPLLKGFVHQTKSVVNLKGLPDKRSNGFDPNAYKLLARAGYSREDINKISKDDDATQLEGKQVSARTRKAWREKKMFGKTLKAGLGYESSTPLHFHINREASRYISAEEVLHSKIPSRMKRQFEWVVSAEETLKGKTRTIVITNPSNEEKEDEIMCLTSNHITIEEKDNDKFVVEEDVEKAPSSLESENKPTMDELKKKPEFISYHKYALKMITSLDCVTLEHVPRKENKQADALANLASTLASCSEEIKVSVCQRWVVPPLSYDIEEKEQVGVFLSKWDGPYVVQEVYTNGAYKIVDENGLRIRPINGKFLKRYYA